MNDIPKELEENPLKIEIAIDPGSSYFTMRTCIDNKADLADLLDTEDVADDPLVHNKTNPIDFDKMNELDQLIYFERARLLNLPLPKKIEKRQRSKHNSHDWDDSEADSNHQLTQKEKSRLRVRKLRKNESEEEHEYRKFRGRIHTMKSRLLLKLKNFENETFLKEVTQRTSDHIKQKRLQQKAIETPDQQAIRKSQVNLARRKLFLRNKAFSTPEDVLSEKEKRIKYLHRTWSRLSEEQRNAKRKYVNEKAKERRKQARREWVMVQNAIKGNLTQNLDKVIPEPKDKV